MLQAKISECDPAAVAAVAADAKLELRDGVMHLDGLNVAAKIRSPEVTAISSIVAANPAVRERLVELQREVGTMGSLVTEGRDQGTVVFPAAKFKFFVTATVDARARRRHRELVAKGSTLTLDTVKTQLRQRDERDENREHAPMKPADDATIVDTSAMSIAQVVEALVATVTHEAN